MGRKSKENKESVSKPKTTEAKNDKKDTKRTEAKNANGKASTAKPETADLRTLEAIFVFSLQPVASPKVLLQQIVKQQRSRGCAIASKCVAKMNIVKNLSDNMFVVALLSKEYPSMTLGELATRTIVTSFKGKDDNTGKYCMVFNRP